MCYTHIHVFLGLDILPTRVKALEYENEVTVYQKETAGK